MSGKTQIEDRNGRRFCTGCRKWISLGGNFWTERGGYRRQCKSCMRKYGTEWWRKNRQGRPRREKAVDPRMGEFMTLKELQKVAYENACARGFHQGNPEIWKFLGNLHGEVSEAWEEARKPDFDPKRTYYREDGKPEGLPSELADILIRVGDMAETFGIDLEKAVAEKMAYNRTRPYRHGNKRA